MPKVWLDAGHGGNEPGAVANGLVEKNMNLVTTLKCKEVLVRHGLTVGLTRSDDRYVGLTERCDMANKWGADYFVSIHYNAGGGDGAEAIHSIFYGKGTDLAKKVVERVHTVTGQNFRPNPTFSKKSTNGKTDYYGVIRQTDMTAIIVEGAFIDNDVDKQIVDTIPEQQKMGIAIAYGILDHLGIAILPEAAVPSNEVYGVTTAKMLNVRSGRGTNYPVICELEMNTRVKLMNLQNGWWSIPVPTTVISSGIGFVSATYIRKL